MKKKQCLPSAPDLALGKSWYAEYQIGTLGKAIFAECQIGGTRQTLFFFHFPSFFSFFSITCFSKFVPINFKNTLSNSLNNIYLIFL